MRIRDQLAFATQSLMAWRARTLLILLAMAIGAGGVILLTWLGDSARRYVVGEFESLGTNLVIVLPGRNETTGGAPPLLGETARDLTLEDTEALRRSPAIHRVAPVVVGEAPVSHGSLSRDTLVLGSTPDLLEVRHLSLAAGTFLHGDYDNTEAVCVLGTTVARELFGPKNPLGSFVRIGDRRFRVLGVLSAGGMSLGTDLDDIVVMPAAAAQALFDSPGVFRVLLRAVSSEAIPRVVADTERILAERHEGERDVTVITQDAVASTFNGILRALTLTVAGIAAISLIVAGILIMNVMVVAVTQRRSEIGLLRALGAEARTVKNLFLAEALLLSGAGCTAGLLLGEIASRILPLFVPDLEPGVPTWAVGAAALTALGSGLLFGTAPAQRAARLDPIQALGRR